MLAGFYSDQCPQKRNSECNTQSYMEIMQRKDIKNKKHKDIHVIPGEWPSEDQPPGAGEIVQWLTAGSCRGPESGTQQLYQMVIKH